MSTIASAENTKQNAVLARLLIGLTTVDRSILEEAAGSSIELTVPGARDVDITQTSHGLDALYEWAQTVHQSCGPLSFEIHRIFESGSEMMVSGRIRIVRTPRTFDSLCSMHLRFEHEKIVLFELLFDTWALEKFRGLGD